MTKITIPDTADLLARIAELEAERAAINKRHLLTFEMLFAKEDETTRLQAALDEIIMEATSRNHAIDIARAARKGDDKKTSQDAK